MNSEIKAKIEQINHFLDREDHDSGYAAFVHMRKLWPELIADYTRSSEQRAEAHESWRITIEQGGDAERRATAAEARLARATGELERLFELFGHQATADVLAAVSGAPKPGE